MRSGNHYQYRNTNLYRIIGDKIHKRCGRCGEFKRVEGEFYWNTTRKTWFTHCIPCHKTIVAIARFGTSDMHGLIPWVQVRPFFIELVNRLGKAEASRRMRVAKSRVSKLVNEPPHHVQKVTARVVMAALLEARAANEVRHRDSILHGAHVRGHEEKVVTDVWKDIYQRHGDRDNEEKRIRRRLTDRAA